MLLFDLAFAMPKTCTSCKIRDKQEEDNLESVISRVLKASIFFFKKNHLKCVLECEQTN